MVRGSIAEVNYFRLGGVDQWVMIRGESLSNPPLILLHGGPGFRRWPVGLAYEIRTTTPIAADLPVEPAKMPRNDDLRSRRPIPVERRMHSGKLTIGCPGSLPCGDQRLLALNPKAPTH